MELGIFKGCDVLLDESCELEKLLATIGKGSCSARLVGSPQAMVDL